MTSVHYLSTVVCKDKNRSSFTIKFLHNVGANQFLKATWVRIATLPTLKYTQIAELPSVAIACTQQSSLNFNITCDVEGFATCSTTFMQILRHLLHKLLVLSKSLPESGAETAMTNADPQSSLSSELHDLCILQKLSVTTSVLSKNFVPIKTQASPHSPHPTNESQTGRSKLLPLWPMFAELSRLTQAQLNCHDPALRLVSVIPISAWRPLVRKKILQKAPVPILYKFDSKSCHLALHPKAQTTAKHEICIDLFLVPFGFEEGGEHIVCALPNGLL